MEVVTQTHYDKAHRKSFEEDDETIYEIQVKFKFFSEIEFFIELFQFFIQMYNLFNRL